MKKIFLTCFVLASLVSSGQVLTDSNARYQMFRLTLKTPYFQIKGAPVSANTDSAWYRASDGSFKYGKVNTSGSTNTSVGSGFKVAINGTNNIKSFTGTNGILIDSVTSNQVGLQVDSSKYETVYAHIADSSTIANASGTGSPLLYSPSTGVYNWRRINFHGAGVDTTGSSTGVVDVNIAAAGSPRYAASTVTVGTNANITAAPGVSYHLPAATLTANRTIDISALNTAGDYIEITNNEAGFLWSFAGALVYLADGVTIVPFIPSGATYQLRLINGKIRIIN